VGLGGGRLACFWVARTEGGGGGVGGIQRAGWSRVSLRFGGGGEGGRPALGGEGCGAAVEGGGGLRWVSLWGWGEEGGWGGVVGGRGRESGRGGWWVAGVDGVGGAFRRSKYVTLCWPALLRRPLAVAL